jgi:hypothetical protein
MMKNAKLVFLRSRLIRFLKDGSSKKKVIIINSHDKIEILAKVIKSCRSYFDPNTAILCFKSRIPAVFRDFADKIKISEDYLNCRDYLKIDNHVFNDISKNWDREAREAFREVFIYRSVELARIAEYEFQLFLLAKIKALAVIGRAIEKENYKAAFIIDSNNELEGFDRLIYKRYHISTDFAGIDEKESFIDTVKRKASSLISDLIDSFSPLLIQKKKAAKLGDARLLYRLRAGNLNSFILAPFEKGLKLRLKCLFKNHGYVAFDLRRNRVRNSANLPEDIGNFNVKSLTPRFVFEDTNYWELVENKIKTLLWKDFVRFRRNIDTMVNARNAHNIKSIVLRNDIRELEKAIALLSKKINISTLVVQHGILAEPNGHDIIFADKVAAWGPRAARWYKQFSNDSAKLALTGNPLFDKIFYYPDLDKGKNSANNTSFTKNEYLVTLISPGIDRISLSSFLTDDITSCIIRDVIKAIKSIGNIKLVIKLHPNERVDTFAKLIAPEDKSFVTITQKADLHRLIKVSDLIITRESTVGLEAILMKKPIVVINLSRRSILVPYAKRNVAVAAYKKGDIENAIRGALYDENVKRKMNLAREDFINDFIYQFDGRATERMLKLIDNML